VSALSGITVADVSGTYKVKPTNNALHQAYSFYIKVSAAGGSSAFFGPYQVKVGCFSDSVTFADNAAFVTSVSKNVAESTASAYTVANPTATLSYCVVTSNEIV
jgi:hypothetical protein